MTVINQGERAVFDIVVSGRDDTPLVQKPLEIPASKTDTFTFEGSPQTVEVRVNGLHQIEQWPTVVNEGGCDGGTTSALTLTLGPHGELYFQFGCESPA